MSRLTGLLVIGSAIVAGYGIARGAMHLLKKSAEAESKAPEASGEAQAEKKGKVIDLFSVMRKKQAPAAAAPAPVADTPSAPVDLTQNAVRKPTDAEEGLHDGVVDGLKELFNTFKTFNYDVSAFEDAEGVVRGSDKIYRIESPNVSDSIFHLDAGFNMAVLLKDSQLYTLYFDVEDGGMVTAIITEKELKAVAMVIDRRRASAVVSEPVALG